MKLALFDFDGTITRHDSFIRFALFARGKFRFLIALMLSLPAITAWKLHLSSNSKAKQTLFSHLFKGMKITDFKDHCTMFRHEIEKDLRPDSMQQISFHQAEGHTVAIVSASIADWILPWAHEHGIHYVLATEIEVAPNGTLSGFFTTPNCHGLEKVNRIRSSFPLDTLDEIWAYGDSAGDDPMLSIAHHPTKITQ